MRVFVAIFIFLVGCSAPVDTELAEQAVKQFHQMLDSGQFEALYSGAAQDLKKATTQQDFVALLGAVHRKLGNVKSFSRKTWNVNYHTSGTFVTLNYSAVYTEGEATEQFVYRLQDGKALLAGYHVNSNALLK